MAYLCSGQWRAFRSASKSIKRGGHGKHSHKISLNMKQSRNERYKRSSSKLLLIFASFSLQRIITPHIYRVLTMCQTPFQALFRSHITKASTTREKKPEPEMWRILPPATLGRKDRGTTFLTKSHWPVLTETYGDIWGQGSPWLALRTSHQLCLFCLSVPYGVPFYNIQSPHPSYQELCETQEIMYLRNWSLPLRGSKWINGPFQTRRKSTIDTRHVWHGKRGSKWPAWESLWEKERFGKWSVFQTQKRRMHPRQRHSWRHKDRVEWVWAP